LTKPRRCATPSRSACGIYATLPPVVHPAGRPRALKTPALLAAPRRIGISRRKRELPREPLVPLGSSRFLSARSSLRLAEGFRHSAFEKRGGLVELSEPRASRVTSLAYRSIGASRGMKRWRSMKRGSRALPLITKSNLSIFPSTRLIARLSRNERLAMFTRRCRKSGRT